MGGSGFSTISSFNSFTQESNDVLEFKKILFSYSRIQVASATVHNFKIDSSPIIFKKDFIWGTIA